MKKLLLMAALALGCMSASAQKTLTLSTYKGTDIEKYDGQTMNVSVSRYIFKGWNTISLPFAMSEEKVNEVFGSDCKLERLVGVENNGTNVILNFQDCKEKGILANVPYILYYYGENESKQFTVENALIEAGSSSVAFTAEGTGETVTMAGAQQQTEPQGLYGILAKANSEAEFVSVDETTNGFYATRCFVEMSSGNSTPLKTNHIAASEVTNIKSVAKANDKVEVFNLSGIKVADSIEGLEPGIYVINGKTVAVK